MKSYFNNDFPLYEWINSDSYHFYSLSYYGKSEKFIKDLERFSIALSVNETAALRKISDYYERGYLSLRILELKLKKAKLASKKNHYKNIRKSRGNENEG